MKCYIVAKRLLQLIARRVILQRAGKITWCRYTLDRRLFGGTVYAQGGGNGLRGGLAMLWCARCG